MTTPNTFVRKHACCAAVLFLIVAVTRGDFIPLSGEGERNCEVCDLQSGEAKARRWGEISQGLHLSVYVSNTVFSVGQSVVASVAMQNITDQNIEYPWDIKMFALSMIREKNIEVPLTARGRRLTGGAFTGDTPDLLPPQKAVKMRYPLDKIFDMTKPGKYIVTAKSYAFKATPNTVAELISNVTTVEVVAAASKTPEPKVEGVSH